MTVFLSDKVDAMVQWDEVSIADCRVLFIMHVILHLQYCHYVAGLVGIGLSRVFSASELESEEVGQDHQLANSMGLFLQKTNIIRDYLEDILQGREFWPREVHVYILIT